MTIHIWRNRDHLASFCGPESSLQTVGEIAQELYPGSTLVLSDEDELSDDQIAILNEIADYQDFQLQMAYHPASAF